MSKNASPNLIWRLVTKIIFRPVGVGIILINEQSFPSVPEGPEPGVGKRPEKNEGSGPRRNHWHARESLLVYQDDADADGTKDYLCDQSPDQIRRSVLQKKKKILQPHRGMIDQIIRIRVRARRPVSGSSACHRQPRGIAVGLVREKKKRSTFSIGSEGPASISGSVRAATLFVSHSGST